MNSKLNETNPATIAESHLFIPQENQQIPLPQEPIFLDDGDNFSDFESNFILSFQTVDTPQSVNLIHVPHFESLNSTFPERNNSNILDPDFVSSYSPQISDQSEPSTKGKKNNSNAGKRKQQTWTKVEDTKLKELYGLCMGKWNEIAKQLPNRNASQCQQRWRRINPPKENRKIWQREEDLKLQELVGKLGKQWKKIAEIIGNITGKQARERYINKLDTKINKQAWSQEEDQIILNYFHHNGPKWTKISQLLEGRPENHIKNRFYSFIQRNYLGQTNRYQIVYNDAK